MSVLNKRNLVLNIAPNASNQTRDEEVIASALQNSPLGEEFYQQSDNSVTQYLATELALVWSDFEQRISEVPVIKKLEAGKFTLADYKTLLLNLRQQVSEGGRWLSRAASSMENDLFPIRSALIQHANDEHRDYLMLDKMYVGLGGSLENIQNTPRNIGSEIFTAYMFQQASQTNPVQLFGAMFLIEGLGNKKAGAWAQMLKDQLNLADEDIIFMLYHSDNDVEHYERLKFALSLPQITQERAEAIVRMARIVARLYCLQFEEMNNF